MKKEENRLTLAIESSCDETSAAVLRGGRTILSNVISTQIPIHQKFGGVVPEIASRKHIVNIMPVIDEAVRQAGDGKQFYFVMTDRFANGDTANDTGGLTGDRLTTGFDPTSSGFYNGGGIAGLRANLDYIAGLGTNASWLTPIFMNKPV